MSTIAAPANPVTTWTIDPAHSSVGFAVRHMMVATVKGNFSQIDGTVVYDGRDLSTASIDVTIPVASIDTKNEQRDTHLRSPDFFDAGNHPVATFRSTRVTGDPSGELEIVGNLTIRGITKEVTLKGEAHGLVRDPWGSDRAGFSASTKVNRHDFGLDWNAALEAGGVVVAPEVRISIDLEITKPAA